MAERKKKEEPVELIGWNEVSAKLGRSVADAQAFVRDNPSFPLIRNGKGCPVRASIARVEAWLEQYYLAFEEWNRRQSTRHWEDRITRPQRFAYRPGEAPGLAEIKGR